MKRQEAIRVLTGRLRSSRVRHSAGFDSGQMQITMGFNAVYAPDHRIESCIWFYEDTMEARCYYSSLGAELCRKSRHIDALLRLLNFTMPGSFHPAAAADICCTARTSSTHRGSI